VHRVLAKDLLAPGVVRVWIDAPQIARQRRAGQFVIVRLHDEGERIPLTIADVNPVAGAIALIVQAVGKTTRGLNALEIGDAILDVVGPLGRPTHIEPWRAVCCVAGGIGAAVVLPIAREAHHAGGRVIAILGARTRNRVILASEFRAIAAECHITTDDGSYGRRGLVTDVLREVVATGHPRVERVMAAGPVQMMRAVCDVTRPIGLPTIVSLNPIMIDGTGMCGGCRVSVGGQLEFACVDGPEFDGHQVNFEELTARLSAYREQENAAAARVERRRWHRDGEEDHSADENPDALPRPAGPAAHLR
jgi:ferredoxin/flavodoxin---NADP+ reductase